MVVLAIRGRPEPYIGVGEDWGGSRVSHLVDVCLLDLLGHGLEAALVQVRGEDPYLVRERTQDEHRNNETMGAGPAFSLAERRKKGNERGFCYGRPCPSLAARAS